MRRLSCSTPVLLVVCLASLVSATPFVVRRGGGTGPSSTRISSGDHTVYHQLAQALESRLPDTDVESLEKALQSLSVAQKALKGLDGAAHEAYQRTHSTDGGVTSVRGRARRSASRAASTADAFLAAELCDLMEQSHLEDAMNENGTLAHRSIVLNETQVKLTKELKISVLVLWEPDYCGGAGYEHGSIQDLTLSGTKKRGRILVLLRDSRENDLKRTFDVLDIEPLQVEIQAGLVANEIASVQPHLYRAAGRVLRAIETTLTGEQFINQTDVAIHFIGRSLAGGVASLSAVILDGSLPLPEEKRRTKKLPTTNIGINGTEMNLHLEGLGRGRSSAMVLGPPPCLSANVKASFVKSIIYGDDVVCRTSCESIARLCERAHRASKSGMLGRQVGWMSDVVALTVSSMKSHARGSEGEEARLVVPGHAFLIRPRRLGGICSMHDVGGLKGGREALRAAVLWQLNDVLLSKSLWKHHDLNSYIHGLDKVQLRSLDEEEK